VNNTCVVHTHDPEYDLFRTPLQQIIFPPIATSGFAHPRDEFVHRFGTTVHHHPDLSVYGCHTFYAHTTVNVSQQKTIVTLLP
jgi:hypothetical protein